MLHCIKRVPLVIKQIPLRRSVSTVLGIETSCDDTGCAIVNTEGKVLGESLYSQNAIHVRYGGVNPIIAYELHRNNIEKAYIDAFNSSNIKIEDIDAVAVTTKPGMLVNLQVGVRFAIHLSKKFNKPLIPIHHMEAHALAVRLHNQIPFPFLVLLISGGHCLLVLVEDVDNFYLLGDSLDNPPGEVMDKAARRLKLKNMPEYANLAGGRAIELCAQKAKDFDLFQFPVPLVRNRDCNFSFSGLKDSLIRKLNLMEEKHGVIGDNIIPEVYDLCASFQLAIAEHLAHRTERAIVYCEKKKLIHNTHRNVVVSGGVACNDFIFNSIEIIGKKFGYNVYRPPHKLCTDNGVMIAWNGVEKLRHKIPLQKSFNVKDIMPVAPLGMSLVDDVIECSIPVKVPNIRRYLKVGN